MNRIIVEFFENFVFETFSDNRFRGCYYQRLISLVMGSSDSRVNEQIQFLFIIIFLS